MIVLRTPKGWTGPKEVDGKPVEDTWRSHQVPMSDVRDEPGHLAVLEEWMRSYRPDELFDDHGTLRPELAALAPEGDRRMSANPHANGGMLLQRPAPPGLSGVRGRRRPAGIELVRGDTGPGRVPARRRFGSIRARFGSSGPDETASNRLQAVFDVTDKAWSAETLPTDEHLAPDGRVLEVLSEHTCQGWLEGYLLTGRHGLFNCYEAFIHIVDSMFNQHAKWLKTTREIPWRRPIASLNYLLSSHVWRQDHNGFSHQDPGFIDHVMNKKAEVIRVYLPPDANTLLSVADHCLRSRNYVNVIVAGKQMSPNWLSMPDAVLHATRGAGIWPWASNDQGGEPDVVLGCAGDVPTLEILAAADILRQRLPDLKVRVVNVVDLMRLQDEQEHPHGMSHREFDALFTTDRPIVFAYHGYPWLIHRLTYRRTNHPNLHVRGYKEEGTTTTPFDMVMLNDLDRFHLVIDVIDRVPGLVDRARRTATRDGGRQSRGPSLHPSPRRGRSEHPRLELAGLTPASMRVLVLNPGSSTLKAAVLVAKSGEVVADDTIEWQAGLEGAAAVVATALDRLPSETADAVGYRVVHGGSRFTTPSSVDDTLLSAVEELDALAPLHNRRAASVMRAAKSLLPDLQHVACFDTAFHADLPEEARRYPLPAEWVERWGIRRYGFHGLSVTWAVRRASELLERPPGDTGARGRTSRLRLLGHRGRRRSLGGHVDGLHALRRLDDGHARRVGRSGHPAPPCRRRSPSRGAGRGAGASSRVRSHRGHVRRARDRASRGGW